MKFYKIVITFEDGPVYYWAGSSKSVDELKSKYLSSTYGPDSQTPKDISFVEVDCLEELAAWLQQEKIETHPLELG